MRDLIEAAFFLTGTIVMGGKIAAAILVMAVLFYGCYRTTKFMKRIRLLRSHATCQ